MRKFLPPDVVIELRGEDGKIQKRRLRNDLGSEQIMQGFYFDWELFRSDKQKAWQKYQEDVANADPLELIPQTLFAMTSHERQDGETVATFKAMIGAANLEYVSVKIAEAKASTDVDEEDPTTAPNGSVKRSPTGKRSKRLLKDASASQRTASIQ